MDSGNQDVMEVDRQWEINITKGETQENGEK